MSYLPPINGIENINFLTCNDALCLEKILDSLVILGGGYIAVELGYFFESMGTDVKIVEMEDTLIPREDKDIAKTFTDIASDRHEIYTGHKVVYTSSNKDGVVVNSEANNGETTEIHGDKLLVAVGRRPNTDKLNLEVTDVETDEDDFIKTNNYLETTGDKIWSQGDIAGNFMFKHSGDYETQYIIDTLLDNETEEINYDTMPHAIFSKPQIAGVGKTKRELDKKDKKYFVGKAKFKDSAMGRAKKLNQGFVKIYGSKKGEILGCQIIGYQASILIHEAVIAI